MGGVAVLFNSLDLFQVSTKFFFAPAKNNLTCLAQVESLESYVVKDNVINNMAWWLKSAGALNFALSQKQCPISL